MTDIQITGYHTCKTEGGWSYIRENAPFISGSGSNQWLTQGYYFWTDSDHFARKWGEDSYNNEYAILECCIELDDNLLLDIVGSVKDKIYFRTILTKFRDKLKKNNQDKEPTVQAVIAYWRKVSKKNNNIFPYLAVKAETNTENKETISFTS